MTIIRSVFSSDDINIMTQLIEEASHFKGLTKPNPMVGAGLVKNGQLIASGVHEAFGADHAERQLFNSYSGSFEGLELFVTLEPCTHYGNTPPCNSLILKSGIKRLVIATLDPNPKIETCLEDYKAHGILVEIGCCEKEAIELNESYFKRFLYQKPFVSMKVATTLDGRIATASGDSCYITSEESRKQCHRLRRSVDMIAVGVDTVIKDDPELTVRYDLLDGGYSQPNILILDSSLRTPKCSKLFSIFDKDSLFIATTCSDDEWAAFDNVATRIQLPAVSHEESWRHILSQLFDYQIYHLLIEGGSGVFSSALSARIVDRYHAFMSPSVMNDSHALPVLKGPDKSSLSSIHSPVSRTVTDLETDIWVNCKYYSSEQWLKDLYAQS